MGFDDDARMRALAALPVTDERLDAAGVQTAVLVGGEGPPIVLLHGPGESALHWLRVLPSLATAYRVVAPDLPGHGASGTIPGRDAARAVEWLGTLIDQTCDAPPVVVGATLGGAIAARYATVHGEHLDGLVLVDTLGLTAFAPAPRFGQALNAFLAQPDAKTQDALWQVCAYDIDRVRGQLGETWSSVTTYNLESIGTPEAMAGLGGLMQEFALRAIPEDELERIQTPTTLVWGRHDLATDVAVAEAASARYGWPLHVVEECADGPALEQPEALLAAVEAAIERIEVAS